MTTTLTTVEQIDGVRYEFNDNNIFYFLVPYERVTRCNVAITKYFNGDTTALKMPDFGTPVKYKA